MKKGSMAAGALILIFIIGSVWLLTRKTESTQPPAQTTPAATANSVKTVEIIMTDDGYQPNTITINVGDKLRFVNKGRNAHWPASNIHPTHDLYPEFDPKRGLAPGEKWAFTFLNKGHWPMHDHLYPEIKGVITVK